jgi:tetratricopeptide (TPR) repeat protein
MSTSSAGAVHAIRAPLVGREAEISELDEALARALSTGQPQTISIIGGAGVGKTRLIDELFAKVKQRERRVRLFRGSSREGGPAYGVVQRILRQRFGILEGADPEVQREAVRTAVSEVLGDKRVTEFLHFLGAYLDLQWPESPFIKAFEDDPEQFARIGRAVLRRFIEVDANVAPMVLAFEDLHLANDDSLDLIHTLIESMEGAPVVMITTARPELLTRRPDWAHGISTHRRMELAPLRPDDAAQMMLHLLEPTGDPPEELVDAAVDMAGGNPYLLEQMLRTYLFSGTLSPRSDGTWEVDLDRLDDAQLPLSVDDAIAARIATLTPAERTLLEMAAVMGGVFWLGALVTLGRLDRKVPELWGGAEDLGAHYRDLLTGLAERDYVLLLPDSSLNGEEELAFKHNLERETLYRLTSASQLRHFHREFAEWLEFRLFRAGESARAEEHCEMLATHYERGGETRKAAEYFLAAGDRARERYANAKAADYYAKGLALLGEEDVLRRLEAYHHQGDVLQLAGRNDEAIASFRQMLEIAWRLDLKAKGGAAHNRIGRVYRAIGQLEEAMRHLGTGHALFDAASDARGVASSLDDVGKVHWMRGAYEPADRFMRRSLEIRRELGDPRSIALSLNNLGLVYQDSGRFEEAQHAFHEALAIRREIGDMPGIAQTLNNIATIFQDSGDHVQAQALWNEALEYATGVGDRMRQAVILTNLGENAYRQEQPSQAIAVLKRAEEISSTLGDRILEAEILRGLAKAHMLVHDIAAARSFIQRSIELFEKSRSKPFLAVALRTAGEIASAGGWGGEDHQRAKQSFEQSIRIFEELGNDVELAQSCETYARFLEQDPEVKADPARAEEPARLRARALAIKDRLAASGNEVQVQVGEGGLAPVDEAPAEEEEATHPGA